MDSDCFISKMKSLASCQLSPNEWMSWWNEHEKSLEGFLNSGEFLRLKPRPHGFLWVPILGSQKGAIHYLLDHGIAFSESSDYQKNYQKELNDAVRDDKKRQKQRLKELEAEFPLLFSTYPKFAKSLGAAFCEGDSLEKPVTASDLDRFEAQSDIRIPQELRAFFAIISGISMDGIRIGFDELGPITLLDKNYCRLGEFWKEADGDLIMFDPAEESDALRIYYYAHEENKVRLLRKSLFELVEKEFVSYNKGV